MRQYNDRETSGKELTNLTNIDIEQDFSQCIFWNVLSHKCQVFVSAMHKLACSLLNYARPP